MWRRLIELRVGEKPHASHDHQNETVRLQTLVIIKQLKVIIFLLSAPRSVSLVSVYRRRRRCRCRYRRRCRHLLLLRCMMSSIPGLLSAITKSPTTMLCHPSRIDDTITVYFKVL